MPLEPDTITLTVLGSGTCVPSLTRSSCCLLVETAGQRLLLDLGRGAIHRLLETGVSIGEVTHLLFSHLHPDHTGELVSFLFATKYQGDPRLLPLTIVAARGFSDFYRALQGAYGRWIVLDAGIMDVIELDNRYPDRTECEGFALESRPVEHTDRSLGFRITNGAGLSVVYSGDTDYCEDLVQLARGADLFVCESSFPDGRKVVGHLTPSLAGRAARRAGAKHLVLTHFYPECENEDLAKQCRTEYAGPLTLAEDLLRFRVSPEGTIIG